jgi:hypothetical protein
VRLLGGLLFLAAAAAADPAAVSIDKATASKLAAIGDRALKAGQPEVARRIFERAVELDPDQPIARARLGYRRSGKEWKAAGEPPKGEDTDRWKVADFLKEVRAEEERRVAAYIRGGLKEHYAKLLDRLPRNEEIHKALGHERIGRRYARPELAAATRRFDEQRARWQEIATAATVESDGSAKVPGIGVRPRYSVDGNLVSGTVPDADVRVIASAIHAPRAMLRELFADVRTWTPPLCVFVPPEDYRRCVETLVPAGSERESALKANTYRAPDMAIFRIDDAEHGRDSHAHSVGFHSAAMSAAPRGDGEPDWQAYAWFREGVGYFTATELVGTGIVFYYSTQESSSKIAASVPPPKRRGRAELLGWLQGQILDGTTEPLRNVCGRTLNSLDLLLSLEAWSFVEFLAAYDPENLRGLPAALAEQTEGSYADRSEAALKACFGKGFAELEPLWRAFVLEIM